MPFQKHFCNVSALKSSLQIWNGHLEDLVYFQVAELTAKDPDTMSQLNPDAAEFVPVSPTRNLTSPACAALINDPVIAQSPRRASGNMDISVPNPQEFESEVKSRPSEVLYSNGHESEGVSRNGWMSGSGGNGAGFRGRN